MGNPQHMASCISGANRSGARLSGHPWTWIVGFGAWDHWDWILGDEVPGCVNIKIIIVHAQESTGVELIEGIFVYVGGCRSVT
jgi:hypothetical protein